MSLDPQIAAGVPADSIDQHFLFFRWFKRIHGFLSSDRFFPAPAVKALWEFLGWYP
jgi:hypothetical protein